MKLTEKILAVLAIVAILLKCFFIPGGGPLFVLTVTALSCLYFACGFALFNGIRLRNMFKPSSYSGISTMKIIGGVLMGITLSTVCIGLVFKIQMWPGANPMLIVSIPPTIIILIIVFIKYILTKSKFYLHALIRCTIFSILAIALAFVNELTLVKMKFRDHPNYIKAFEEYQQNPSSEELYQKLQDERMKTFMHTNE